MSNASENARDEALTAIFKTITEEVKKTEKDDSDSRIDRLKSLAEAYGLVTFGVRK